MSIRPAAAGEAEAILALWSAAEAHPTITDTVSAVAHLIREHPGSLLVAQVDGRLAGTVIAVTDGWRGSLYRLAVLPEFRRRGIARALVTEALRRLQDRGIERVSALVIEEDQRAAAFWSSLTDIGVVPDPAPKLRFVANLQPGLKGNG
jgi:ribosomal protein S18 acetylase RimI-like enzyme